MTSGEEPDDELIDAFAIASRALVAIAARSLAGLSGVEITLPQYRALIILSTQGPQRVMDLAERLSVNASTASRMVDRLVRKHLVRRRRHEVDRRATTVELTRLGNKLVQDATMRRRLEIKRILQDLPQVNRQPLISAMVAFAAAAGEPSGTDLLSEAHP